MRVCSNDEKMEGKIVLSSVCNCPGDFWRVLLVKSYQFDELKTFISTSVANIN